MTSTTPHSATNPHPRTAPAPTLRDMQSLIELINEARDHARDLGLNIGMVAIHHVPVSTFDAVVASPLVNASVTVREQDGERPAYRTVRVAGGSNIFGPPA